MVIHLSSYGTLLISRPAGRDAYLAACAYTLADHSDEHIDVDFTGVKVLTPSWLDEFLTPLKKKYGEKVRLGPSDNPSVRSSLTTVLHKPEMSS